MKAEMDLDTLARMMAEGFTSITKEFNTRFEEFGTRFDRLEERMETLEGEVRLTNQHIDRVVMPILDSHASRIKNLELKLA